MKIVIVIPAYNEALNVGTLLDTIAEVIKAVPEHDIHALVVDGNSPDGTAEVVEKKSQTYPWVHLLKESGKRGIGAAYFSGFEYAMKELKADAVVEMDADLQHDPKELPSLLAPLNQGFDYIIGSRFVRGGSIPKDWAFYRKFLSVGGSIFSKVVLGIYNVDDFTTGYKVSRVKGFLDKINFSEVRTKGFAYKMELLFRTYKLGAKIKQVPITFGLRDKGASKMEGDNFLDSLLLVVTLRLNDNKEFFRFCAVGGLGFITDAAIFNILSITSGSPKVSALISGFIAMIVTFVFNNHWSFGARKLVSLSTQLKSFPTYALLSMIPIIFRSALVAYSVSLFGKNFFIYNGAFLLGVVIGLIWNFVVYSKIIWKKTN